MCICTAAKLVDCDQLLDLSRRCRVRSDKCNRSEQEKKGALRSEDSTTGVELVVVEVIVAEAHDAASGMHDVSYSHLFKEPVKVDGIIQACDLDLGGSVLVSDPPMSGVLEVRPMEVLPTSPDAVDFHMQQPERWFARRTEQPHFASDGLMQPGVDVVLQTSTQGGVIGRREEGVDDGLIEVGRLEVHDARSASVSVYHETRCMGCVHLTDEWPLASGGLRGSRSRTVVATDRASIAWMCGQKDVVLAAHCALSITAASTTSKCGPTMIRRQTDSMGLGILETERSVKMRARLYKGTESRIAAGRGGRKRKSSSSLIGRRTLRAAVHAYLQPTARAFISHPCPA
ncbi:hypothetical protein L1887_49895 [Cichorium endivia]|nr:hypothetical protein L1887_49895 [Cichorium endivia]